MAATEGALSIDVYLGGGEPPAGVANKYAVDASQPSLEATRLSQLFAALASGVVPGKVRVRVSSIIGVRAFLTLAVTQANIAAGEFLDVCIPNRGAFRLTAVASSPDVTLGQFVSATDDSTTAANIKAAINGMIGLKDLVSADNSSGNLTITAKEYGTVGNGYFVKDGTVNGLTPAGGSFAGGKDASSQVTSVITCVAANTDADDTIRIGKTTFTAKAGDAAGESQFNIGASNTAMGDNLLAKIIAHSELAGLVTGVAASGVITLTWQCDPRLALHMFMVSSDADGLVLTTQPSITSTLASQQAARTYALGAP